MKTQKFGEGQYISEISNLSLPLTNVEYETQQYSHFFGSLGVFCRYFTDAFFLTICIFLSLFCIQMFHSGSFSEFKVLTCHYVRFEYKIVL